MTARLLPKSGRLASITALAIGTKSGTQNIRFFEVEEYRQSTKASADISNACLNV